MNVSINHSRAQIREATPSDVPLLVTIGQCVWINTYATQGVRESISRYVLSEFTVGKFESLIDTQKVYVIEIGAHIIGYGVVSNSVPYELETLYMLPALQRKGYGKALLGFMQSKYATLKLSCWEENQKAIEFYLRCGFIEVGESYFEMEGERHRNIVLMYSDVG